MSAKIRQINERYIRATFLRILNLSMQSSDTRLQKIV